MARLPSSARRRTTPTGTDLGDSEVKPIETTRRVKKMDDYFDEDFGYYDDDPNPYLGTYSEE